MAIEGPPLWTQGGTYPARLDRSLIAELRDEGVKNAGACKVTQRGSGANFSVDIAPGTFWIQGDDESLQGTYQGRVTSTENVVIGAAPGANSRYDLLTLRINDPAAGGNTGNTVTAVVVAGTAAASPTVPTLPPSSLPLAVIGPITSGTSSITNALIHDTFTQTGPFFGLVCRLIAGRVTSSGTIEAFAANANKRSGWLYCDGTAYSRTVYADLFAEIGTIYGAGNGTSTFNVPNLLGRVLVAGGTVSGVPIITGTSGGEVLHTLTAAEMPSHTHSYTDPGHAHAITPRSLAPGTDGVEFTWTNGGPDNTLVKMTAPSATYIQIDPAGGGLPHNNMQPYVAISGFAIRV